MGNGEQPGVELRNHERLGLVGYREEGGRVLLTVRRKVQGRKEFESWKARVEELRAAMGAEFLLLPESVVFQEAGVCGLSGELQAVFENSESLLKSEVKSRRKLGQPFPEQELWYVLLALVKAGLPFAGRKLGDAHPRNLLFDAQGQARLLCGDSLPLEPSNFERAVESESSDVYLAPEEMDRRLLERGVYPAVDPSAADLFALGMTLLEAASLFDCYHCYLRGPLRLHAAVLEGLLERVAQLYSARLLKVLRRMLEPDPRTRGTCREIFEQLRPFEELICSLEPFSP